MKKLALILPFLLLGVTYADELYDKEFLDTYQSIPMIDSEEPENLLLGHDKDKDGVRDDVQQSITLKYYKKENKMIQQALLNLAYDYQLATYDYIRQNRRDLSEDVIRILEDSKCLRDVLAYKDLEEKHNISAFNEINMLTSLQFNNKERNRVYRELFNLQPIDLRDKIYNTSNNTCEFELYGIPSSRTETNRKIDFDYISKLAEKYKTETEEINNDYFQ